MPLGSVQLNSLNVALRWNFNALSTLGDVTKRNACALCMQAITEQQSEMPTAAAPLRVVVHKSCGSTFHSLCLEKYAAHSPQPQPCAACGGDLGEKTKLVIQNIYEYSCLDRPSTTPPARTT